jgi:endo-alpha-N-acetylgalactosaminidase
VFGALLAGVLMWAGPVCGQEAKPEKVSMKVVKVDSEETAGEDAKGANAVDGDPNTFWHTQWQDANPPCPHEIIIQLEPTTRIKGFTYLPRQDESDHGTIKEYEFYVSADGKDFGQPVKKGSFENTKEKKTALFPATAATYIKLVALSEVNGEAWTSAAEIGIVREEEKVTAPLTLAVVKADSEETAGEDGKAANAVDGDPKTFWHTQWQDANPEPPHEIILKLSKATQIKGFTYLPRQDDSDHGNIKEYEFYVNTDGKDFGQPVKKGSFENTKDKKTVTFDPKMAGYVKLRALSEVNGEAWTSAAEITVIPAEQ